MSSVKEVNPGEMKRLLDALKDQLQKRYQKSEKLRAFHPKMHGLVKAYLEIPPDLPVEYQTALFIPGKKYQTLVRFSNGNSRVLSDKQRDLRGIALKIIGVSGQKVLEDEKEASTQDILMANYEVFPPATFHGTVASVMAVSGSVFKKIGFAFRYPSIIFQFVKGLTICSDLLKENYFSQVPYRFKETIVKYRLKPRNKNLPTPEANSEDHFLRERLSKSLSTGEVFFDLFIQMQQKGDPVYDASVKWKGPYVHVATLRLLQQEFDTPVQNAYGEKLSFTPWHSLPEHAPAGDIGLARKEVYRTMSKFRGGILKEPESFEV